MQNMSRIWFSRDCPRAKPATSPTEKEEQWQNVKKKMGSVAPSSSATKSSKGISMANHEGKSPTNGGRRIRGRSIAKEAKKKISQRKVRRNNEQRKEFGPSILH
jgi:hypothetical protein